MTQGLVALVAVTLVMFWGARQSMPETELRALTFFTLVIVIVALIFVNRSFKASLRAAFDRPKPALLVVVATVAGILAAANLLPAAQDIFRFGPLHRDDLIITAGAGWP
ncbi:cation transporting ATPase C-terminal domain-containing protein [Gemmobacter lanyuensis]